MSSGDKNAGSNWAIVLVTLVVALIAVSWVGWATYGPLIADFLLAGDEPAQPGTWGDTFGALNTLFAGLAFSGVLATIWSQGKAFREQQLDQHRQRFESSFFELLRLMREVKKEVRFQYSREYADAKRSPTAGNPAKTGPIAIRNAALEVRFWLTDLEARTPGPVDRSQIAEIYRKRIHSRYESSLGPYFRLIYTVLHRIRTDHVLSDTEKNRYGNLLRSQLTSHEVALCGLNGLTPISKDFFDLVVGFRLLKYLPEGSMRRRLVRYYPPQTFLSRD